MKKLSSALAICAAMVLAVNCTDDDRDDDDTGTDGGQTTDGGTDGGQTTDGGTDGGTGGTAEIGEACARDSDCAGPNGRCRTSLPGGYCQRTCQDDADCGGDNFCLLGACLAACETDADCTRSGEGYFCDTDGSCWAYPYEIVNPGGAAVGEACTADSACESGACIPGEEEGRATGYAGGYCSAECNEGAPGTCPANATCKAGLCKKTCTENANCRQGYVCQAGVCDRDPSLVPIGAACTVDNEATACAWGFCLNAEENAGAYPDGYCSIVNACDVEANTGCPAGSTCKARFNYSGAGSYCAKNCAAPTDCRTGYECVSGVCQRPTSNDATKIKIGAACTQDADCNDAGGTNGVCFKEETSEEGTSFPGGYCVAAGCTPEDATEGTQDSCGAKGICYGFGGAPYRFCLARCTEATVAQDCRTSEEYICDTDDTCWYYPPEEP